jgi:hypothetical protein
MAIHVHVWKGSGSARVTDMSEAGRRGRKGRVLRVSGDGRDGCDARGNPVAVAAVEATRQILAFLERCDRGVSFAEACGTVEGLVALARGAGVPEGLLMTYREEIRAIDAPRPLLTAGVEGKWSAGADEDGIHLADLADVNEWREITFGQTKARAYDIARKVWDRVCQAKTLHEASRILTDVGAKLHGYCGLD